MHVTPGVWDACTGNVLERSGRSAGASHGSMVSL